MKQKRKRGQAEGLLPGYLAAWKLVQDGESIVTSSSLLLPVRTAGQPAMLKILRPGSDEGLAHRALRIWRGRNAVQLLRWDERAQLLERLDGGTPLVEMALRGDDDEATRIIADLAGCLHRHGRNGLPRLHSRLRVVLEYENGAASGLITKARIAFRELGNLSFEQTTAFHGDLHHGNIMRRGSEYVAIAPKGLAGNRTYDLANLLLNPYPHRDLVMDRDRMHRRVEIICEILDLVPEFLLLSTLIHGCAAAAWAAGDAEAERWWLDGAALAHSLLEDRYGHDEIPFDVDGGEQWDALTPEPFRAKRDRDPDDDIPF